MKKNYLELLLCYILWGFQPLYWTHLGSLDSFTVLGLRIVFAAIFSVLILAMEKRLGELKAVFKDKAVMKHLIPATLFLLGDWGIFIIAVRNGHVLDTSLGYYINPLVLFAVGLIIYKEKSTRMQLVALGVALTGVIVSAVSFGKIPLLSLVIALDWAVYASIKKDVRLDGVLSIAAETIMLSGFALAFLLFFRMPELRTTDASWWIIVGSGIVTALPMYLYSGTVSKMPLTIMCFIQYLSPTFNVICGLIMGESFSASQLTSLAFFVTAIIIFSVSELKNSRIKN